MLPARRSEPSRWRAVLASPGTPRGITRPANQTPPTGPADLSAPCGCIGRGFAIRHRRQASQAYPTCYPTFVRKTSVYLTERESERLAELARSEGRSQAEIIREAITAYVPAGRAEGDLALAAGFERIDNDPRTISEIPEDELLHGFGR